MSDALDPASGPAPPPTGTRALMQQLNAARVIHELRRGGPSSRAELSRAMGLSKPTISALTDTLTRLGYIEPIGADTAQAGPGRKGQLYQFRPDFRYLLGADIGAEKIVLVVADLAGSIHSTVRIPTPHASSASILAAFDAASAQALTEAGVARSALMCAVVGTPGIVAPDGSISAAPQLPDWEGTVLATHLARALPCQVTVDREANLLMLAECWQGQAAQLSTALLVQLGIGVGASLLVDGQIVRGSSGAAGEIGLMPIGYSIEPPQFGFGPFEWITGGRGIATRGLQAARRAKKSGILAAANGQPDAVDAAAVFAAARRGDRTARRIVHDAVQTLATGIATLCCAVNPEVVILSGGLARSHEQIVPLLTDELTQWVPYPPQVLISGLSDAAVALGAVRHALDLAEDVLATVPDLSSNPERSDRTPGTE